MPAQGDTLGFAANVAVPDAHLAPQFSQLMYGATAEQASSSFDEHTRRVQSARIALAATLTSIAAYAYGTFSPLTDPITTFLNNHTSYAIAAPLVGLAADYLVNKSEWLRQRRATVLAAGATLVATGIYETDAGYEAVGRAIDDNVVDPTNVHDNKEDPIDTLVALTWIGFAMLFSHRRLGRQQNT